MTKPARNLTVGDTIVYQGAKTGTVLFKTVGYAMVSVVLDRTTGGQVVVNYTNKDSQVKVLELMEEEV